VTRTAAVSALLLAAASTAGSPHAIVIRHDRDDARYRALGEKYPSVVVVGSAVGTLIASEWVLTAAHVVDGLSPISGTVTVGEQVVPVERVVLHPTWIGDLGPGLAELEWIDMALVKLARPVTSVVPASLYSGREEAGKTVSFVGNGKTGDGMTGPDGADRAMRGATNRVSRVDDDWLYFTFDAPPDATDLEGISGPGDSGGPAFLVIEGRPFVVGVGSRNDDHGLGLCRYGTTEVYSRVSTRRDWIRETMAAEEGPGSVVSMQSGTWPATPAGRAAAAFFTVYNSGDETRLTGYANDMRSEESRRIQPDEDWVRLWGSQRCRTGPVTPTHLAELNGNKIVVLAAGGDHWRSYRFEVQGRMPFKLRALTVVRVSTLGGRPLPAPPATRAKRPPAGPDDRPVERGEKP